MPPPPTQSCTSRHRPGWKSMPPCWPMNCSSPERTPSAWCRRPSPTRWSSGKPLRPRPAVPWKPPLTLWKRHSAPGRRWWCSSPSCRSALQAGRPVQPEPAAGQPPRRLGPPPGQSGRAGRRGRAGITLHRRPVGRPAKGRAGCFKAFATKFSRFPQPTKENAKRPGAAD